MFPELRFTEAEIRKMIDSATPEAVVNSLAKEKRNYFDLLNLISPAAMRFLPQMREASQKCRRRYYGKTVTIYAPLYISNSCVNGCKYCDFNIRHKYERKSLTLDEIRQEADAILAMGIDSLLIVAGEDPVRMSVDFLCEVGRMLKEKFSYLSLEIAPQEEEGYRRLFEAGYEGLTLFQETYNPELYAWLHPVGPKHDYGFRLNAPERAARAGMRSLGVGALLGLESFEQDAFCTGLHAWWLQRNFPGVDVSVSIPRICPHEGEFDVQHGVDDRHLVQYVTATRCFLPRAGITCSSRESAFMRDHLVPLGVTRVSAGVSTAVGGRATEDKHNPGQFEITDHRSLAEMIDALAGNGYQAVIKDWEDPAA